MWHASTAPRPGWPADRAFLRGQALCALLGLGDARAGQWEEWSGRAFHLRRRLSAREARRVGDPVDIRGTPEEAERLARLPARVRAALGIALGIDAAEGRRAR